MKRLNNKKLNEISDNLYFEIFNPMIEKNGQGLSRNYRLNFINKTENTAEIIFKHYKKQWYVYFTFSVDEKNRFWLEGEKMKKEGKECFLTIIRNFND